MDTDDHPHSGHHRPPILFQSDEHDHDQDHHHSHNRNHQDHHVLDEHPASHPHSLRHRRSEDTLTHLDQDKEPDEHQHQHRHHNDYLWQMDEAPLHVHSQACEDSCPVQDIYTEASYFRFSKGARTNLYGLAVLKELGTSAPSEALGSQITASTTPNSTRSSIFSNTGELVYGHLPGRYVLVAAGSSIKCFLGLQDSFEIPLGVSSGSSDEAGNATVETPVIGNDSSVATAPAPNQEIVSLDAFERKDERGCQLIVVVSIAKAEDTAQFELRCYGANTFGSTIRELLLQLPDTTDIQSIPLSWAPTKIIHAPVEEDPFEMAILVGGSDSCVHLFVQDKPSESSKGLIEERPIESYLPVLASFAYCEYCVLSLVIKDYPAYRIVAAGTQNGTLNVGIIPRDPNTFQLQRDRARSHAVVLFAPITTLTVYTSRVQTERSTRKSKRPSQAHGVDSNAPVAADHEGKDAPGDVNASEEEEEEEEGIHLLVTCAIEQAWIYSDINKHGLDRRSDLAECSYHDSILAAHIMDADWDGRNEIMIGTYGRQLMVFKELPPGQEPFPLSSYADNTSEAIMRGSQSYGQDAYPPTHPHQQHPHHNHHHHPHHQEQQRRHGSMPASGVSGSNSNNNARALQCSMTWNRRFASPIYGISSADLNDDGLEELVITTLNGVSFFLPDPIAAKQRLSRAVTRMQEIEEMKLTLEKLRKENEDLQEARRAKEEKEKQQAQEKEAGELEEKERKEREEQEAKDKESRDREEQASKEGDAQETMETEGNETVDQEGQEKAQQKENDKKLLAKEDEDEEEDEEHLEKEDGEQLEKEDEETELRQMKAETDKEVEKEQLKENNEEMKARSSEKEEEEEEEEQEEQEEEQLEKKTVDGEKYRGLHDGHEQEQLPHQEAVTSACSEDAEVQPTSVSSHHSESVDMQDH